MKKQSKTKIIGNLSIIIIIATTILCAWYFSNITIYVIIASIITLLANPLKHLLTKIKLGNWHLGNGLNSFLALLIVIGILVGIVVLITPPVYKQIQIINSIDTEKFESSYNEQLKQIDDFLINYGIIQPSESLEAIIVNTVLNKSKNINLTLFFGNLIQMTGKIFLGIFSILFISFFFLKDLPKLQNTIINMMPNKHQDETEHVLSRSKKLLSNYFIGLIIEVILVALLEFFLLSILDIQNALLIAVLGGIFVIIPYLGSIIACIVGCILAVMSAYTINPDILIWSIVLKVIGTFAVCRLLDNFILQPYIASKSVKAHPLEIFIIILISGSIAGIPGMMLGIPAYTIVRIIAQEFFSNNNFVKTLTKNLTIDDENNSLTE